VGLYGGSARAAAEFGGNILTGIFPAILLSVAISSSVHPRLLSGIRNAPYKKN
jgi:hypothetical protein